MTRTPMLRAGWASCLMTAPRIARRHPLKATLPALLTLALAAPAQAQSLGRASSSPSVNPWQGIAITVSPPDDSEPAPSASPYEAAQQAAQPAEPQPGAEPAATPVVAQPEPDPEAPSLWQVLNLGLGGDTPEPVKPPPAPNQLLPERKPAVTRSSDPLPTSVDLSHGPASVGVSTSASGSAPKSGLAGASAGGASAAVTGRVGYEQDNLAVYSTGTLSASASTSAPSVSDNMAVGSKYTVPLAPLGLGDHKLDASVEVNNSRTTTAGVELRTPGNGYERFISVERTSPADANASGVVKAGVLGKF
ncbi:hypothetical protein FHS55_002474 [Angulomicrobium tetraedrale]|uniref:Uncharacterized protein n=1 Tax=Ancylobacter tetraedralis TaxID=217068 RepID=A0A839ZAW7_9HYPH|nr:hypothetical protein [Ancylobacter tetraedralis]MBB3771865.1 hypothetical protein [Ancylobacter tetraedralis]